MARVLATVNDEQKAWVESQSDSLGVPEAEIIRRLIDAGRADESLIESQSNHDSQTDSANESDLIHRLDELEERMAALEAGRDAPPDPDAAHNGTDGFDPGGTESPSPASSSALSSTADEDGDVRDRVETFAEREGWDDDGRLADRVDAAVAAVRFAREHGSISKGEAIDKIEPEYSVRGQSPKTWYRNNIRPVLGELGEYDSAAQGYRVNVKQT
jgi:hypothetical protein